jgi:signal transduction histidine kinase
MGQTIFIVEDEMIVNQNIKQFLERNGYSVEMFSHGEPCLDRLNAGVIPDLILMDINLGHNRMDGPAVTQRIYETHDIPVVLHSAYTDKSTLDKTRNMTKFGYIQKVPGNEQFILAIIDMALKLFESNQAHIESERKYRELLRYNQNVREEQNEYIAREIHDELGQSLTSLQMSLAIMENDIIEKNAQGVTGGVREMISEMKETLDETISKTRELSWLLKPAVLDYSGIIEALEWQVCEYRRKRGLPITFFSSGGDCSLEKNRALAVYRIVQEALTNIARYAEATDIRVESKVNSESITVWIRDNGKGFDTDTTSVRDSFGILGMKERADQFGGEVILESTPGEGTKVYMRMPIS